MERHGKERKKSEAVYMAEGVVDEQAVAVQ